MQRNIVRYHVLLRGFDGSLLDIPVFSNGKTNLIIPRQKNRKIDKELKALKEKNTPNSKNSLPLPFIPNESSTAVVQPPPIPVVPPLPIADEQTHSSPDAQIQDTFDSSLPFDFDFDFGFDDFYPLSNENETGNDFNNMRSTDQNLSFIS